MAPSSMFSYLHGIRAQNRRGSKTNIASRSSQTSTNVSPPLPASLSGSLASLRQHDLPSVASNSPALPAAPVPSSISSVFSKNNPQTSMPVTHANNHTPISSTRESMSSITTPQPDITVSNQSGQSTVVTSSTAKPVGKDVYSKNQWKQSTARKDKNSSPKHTMSENPPSHHEPGHQSRHSQIFHNLHSKSGKTKLNLLNPMALLARRRSSQAVVEKSSDSHSRIMSLPGMQLPDDFDPRIRGKVVHDFNVPRPKRNYSSSDATLFLQTNANGGASFASSLPPLPDVTGQSGSIASRQVDKPYTPVFKEHFGDEITSWKGGGQDSKELTATNDLSQMDTSFKFPPEPERGTKSLPPFARNLPQDPEASSSCVMTSQTVTAPPALAAVPEAEVVSQTGLDKTPPLQSLPPKARSRSSSLVEQQASVGGSVPKRLTSNSSRFSFDLVGSGSTPEERILEERHKQREAARKKNMLKLRHSFSSDDEDDLTPDDFLESDDLEEPIPGINADATADDENVPGVDGDTRGYSFISPSADKHSSALTNPEYYKPPQLDLAGLESPQTLEQSILENISNASDFSNPVSRQPLDVDSSPLPTSQATTSLIDLQGFDENDDLYFDDGLIGDQGSCNDAPFDESVFDQESFLKPVPKQILDEDVETGVDSDSNTASANPGKGVTFQDEVSILGGDMNQNQNSISLHTGRPKSPNQYLIPTMENMHEYHDALAAATAEAAVNGRFDRRDSQSEVSEATDNLDSRSSLARDDSRTSQDSDVYTPFGYDGEAEDDFPYDDLLEDESIIAAANAEALENDDEGFYGQEFGFYAQSYGDRAAEFANGGYFCPVGPEGVRRSHSGRANFQEPSLTPITERSEWSNRGSVISLSMLSASAQTLPSPTLAQLATEQKLEDDDLSLNALIKLRKGAWGSTGSLPISPITSVNPLPLVQFPVSSSSTGSGGYASDSQVLASKHTPNSVQDLTDRVSDSSVSIDFQDSPGGVHLSGNQASPISTPSRSYTVSPSHSRNSSGADSVSYIRERDADGSGRWVLERRKTVGGGEMEVIGRQVLAKGEI